MGRVNYNITQRRSQFKPTFNGTTSQVFSKRTSKQLNTMGNSENFMLSQNQSARVLSEAGQVPQSRAVKNSRFKDQRSTMQKSEGNKQSEHLNTLVGTLVQSLSKLKPAPGSHRPAKLQVTEPETQLDSEKYADKFADAQTKQINKMQLHASQDMQFFVARERAQTASVPSISLPRPLQKSYFPKNASLKTQLAVRNALCKKSLEGPLPEHIQGKSIAMGIARSGSATPLGTTDAKSRQVLQKFRHQQIMHQNFSVLASQRQPKTKNWAVASTDQKKVVSSNAFLSPSQALLQPRSVTRNSKAGSVTDFKSLQLYEMNNSQKRNMTLAKLNLYQTQKPGFGTERKPMSNMHKQGRRKNSNLASSVSDERARQIWGQGSTFFGNQRGPSPQNLKLSPSSKLRAPQESYHRDEDLRTIAMSLASPSLNNENMPRAQTAKLDFNHGASKVISEAADHQIDEDTCLSLDKNRLTKKQRRQSIAKNADLVLEGPSQTTLQPYGSGEFVTFKNHPKSPKSHKSRSRSPPKATGQHLAGNYGRLHALKMRQEKMVRLCFSCQDEETEHFLVESNVSYRIVSTKDRMVFKQLKSLDFDAGRTLLLRQLRENPYDLALVHNKAVVLALERDFEQSMSLFEKVQDQDQEGILQTGWQFNWALVVLRQGNFDGVKDILSKVIASDSFESNGDLAAEIATLYKYAEKRLDQIQEAKAQAQALLARQAFEKKKSAEAQAEASKANEQSCTFAKATELTVPQIVTEGESSRLSNPENNDKHFYGVRSVQVASRVDQDYPQPQPPVMLEYQVEHTESILDKQVQEPVLTRNANLNIKQPSTTTKQSANKRHYSPLESRKGKPVFSEEASDEKSHIFGARGAPLKQATFKLGRSHMPEQIAKLEHAKDFKASTHVSPKNQAAIDKIYRRSSTFNKFSMSIPEMESASEPNRDTEPSGQGLKDSKTKSFYRSKTLRTFDELRKSPEPESLNSFQLTDKIDKTPEQEKEDNVRRSTVINKNLRNFGVVTPHSKDSSDKVAPIQRHQTAYVHKRMPPRRAGNNSESNIYQEPDSPKARRFRTIHHVGDDKLEYQEVNSDGSAVGSILKSLPREQETSGKHSNKSKSTPDNSSALGGQQSNGMKAGNGQKQQHGIFRDDLEPVKEHNEDDDVRSAFSSPIVVETPGLGTSLQTSPLRQTNTNRIGQRLSVGKFQSPMKVNQANLGAAISPDNGQMTFGKAPLGTLKQATPYQQQINATAEWRREERNELDFCQDKVLQGASSFVNVSKPELTGHRLGHDDSQEDSLERNRANHNQSSRIQKLQIDESESAADPLRTAKVQSSGLKRRKVRNEGSKSMADFNFSVGTVSKQNFAHSTAARRITGSVDSHLAVGEGLSEECGNHLLMNSASRSKHKSSYKTEFKSLAKAEHLHHFQSQRVLKVQAIDSLDKKSHKTSKSKPSEMDQSLSKTGKAGSVAGTRERETDQVGQQLAYQSMQTIRAVEKLRLQETKNGDASKSKTLGKAPEARQANPISSMVNKTFSDVERFRNVIGGKDELVNFIKKLSAEGGTGEIYEMQNRKKNQMRATKSDFIPRAKQTDVSAFELTNSKYEAYQRTIYFLLDLYDRKGKSFSKFIAQMEENAKLKEEEDKKMLAQRPRETTLVGNRFSLARKTHSSVEYSSSSLYDEEIDEEEKLLLGGKDRVTEEQSVDKYKIPMNVSGIALSILKERNRSTASLETDRKVSAPIPIQQERSQTITQMANSNTFDQGSLITPRLGFISKRQIMHESSGMVRITLGAHGENSPFTTGEYTGQSLHRAKYSLDPIQTTVVGNYTTPGRAIITNTLDRKGTSALKMDSQDSVSDQFNSKSLIDTTKSRPHILIDSNPVASVQGAENSTQRKSSGLASPFIGKADESTSGQKRVNFQMTQNSFKNASNTDFASKVKENSQRFGMQLGIVKSPSLGIEESKESADEEDDDFVSDTDSGEYEGIVPPLDGKDADPLTWQQHFSQEELVEILDLEREYKSIFMMLDENPKTRQRAERLNKLIKANKLTWWEQDNTAVHEVLGIERHQFRRMKLIMAKLSSRINKKKSAKKLTLKSKPAAQDLTQVKQVKKVSFVKTKTQKDSQTKAEQQPEKIVYVNPMAKYKKFKKFEHLARPKYIEDTYSKADQLASEKTLAEMQQIVLKSLKRIAVRKRADPFMQDLAIREKEWAAQAAEEREAQPSEGGNGGRAKGDADSSLTSVDNAPSVNLSDIKSENESIYWEQQRGNVEAVDVLINNERMFDHDMLDEFQKRMELFNKVVTQPGPTSDDTDMSTARDKARMKKRVSGHN